jgi:hypothetical protein
MNLGIAKTCADRTGELTAALSQRDDPEILEAARAKQQGHHSPARDGWRSTRG